MIMIDLYLAVYGKDAAARIWDSIFKYYSQSLAYYNQYSGTSKAAGVNALLQETVQLLYGLNQMAEQVLNDKERAESSLKLLQQQGYSL
jgi:hypothetical protein